MSNEKTVKLSDICHSKRIIAYVLLCVRVASKDSKGDSGMGQMLDGKALAIELRESIRGRVVEYRRKTGTCPVLAVIFVGEDPASYIYVRNKKNACVKAGIGHRIIRLSKSFSTHDVLWHIRKLNEDADVNGILVQLPLPAHIDPSVIIEAIDPAKDVDGLHPYNVGRLMNGVPNLVPCTPLGCIKLLERAHIDLEGKHVVVLGRSAIVGKPFAILALQNNATVTLAHSKTRNVQDLARQADVLVSAIGQAGLVRGDWIKEGATVLDVGITRHASLGKVMGDIAFDEVLPRALWVTPVPGGVGPMTIACLLENTLRAACIQNSVTLTE